MSIYRNALATPFRASSIFSRRTPTTVSYRTQASPATFLSALHTVRFRMASESSSTGPDDDVGPLLLRNRLAESRSPYVRGHADNPVAWQNWSDETIQLAKRSNRLIFLSIGYAACHWCHVMERESFENEVVAAIINESFIPIKVDREERPDVDRIYMNYVQATTGSGGWPLNVFLTPELEPIFGGTYWPGPNANLPSRMRHQAPFLDILKKLGKVWKDQPERCRRSAKHILSQLKRFADEGSSRRLEDGDEGETVDIDLLDDAYIHFVKRYDKEDAGFGTAPKFPTPVNLSFLLRLRAFPALVADILGEVECKNAASMAVATLRRMAKGGIHDHIGHGFARYSVTADWSLPHFEKMLYDQAQLLDVYLDAYLLTKEPDMLACVNDIADYLTTDALAAPNGGFYSAEDADSYYRPSDTEKREGAFYVWTRKEFDDVLGERAAEICAHYWNVKRHGNVSPAHDAHDEFTNQNVLNVAATPAQLAREFGMAEDDVIRLIETSRQKLREHRDKERPRPNLDDKIVTSWNGLAIGSLARVSAALEDSDPQRASRYRRHAARAARFVRDNLFDEDTSKLRRVYREGPGDVWGFADDYAFMIKGLIELYEATFDESYLAFADRLQKSQISLFWDPVSSGFFSTESTATNLILRLKDGMDNAEPSANGISSQNLCRLSGMLGDDSYGERARQTWLAFEPELMEHPFLFTSMMPALVVSALGVRSVVLVGQAENVDTAIKTLRGRVSGVDAVVRAFGDDDPVGALALADVIGISDTKNASPSTSITGDDSSATTATKGTWLKQRNALIGHLNGDRPRIVMCEPGMCRDVDTLPSPSQRRRRSSSLSLLRSSSSSSSS